MRYLLSLSFLLLGAVPAWTPAASPPGSADERRAPSAASSSSSSPAAQGKPATPSSRKALALSRALVPKQTWDRLLDRSAEGLSQAVSRSLSTKGAKVPDDLKGSIRRELGQSLKYDSAVDTQAQALQKRFTPDELDTAAKFYGSQVGQKMLQRLPEAQSEVGDALQEQLASLVPEIVHRVAPDAMSGMAGGAGPQDGAPSDGAPSAPSEGTGNSP